MGTMTLSNDHGAVDPVVDVLGWHSWTGHGAAIHPVDCRVFRSGGEGSGDGCGSA